MYTLIQAPILTITQQSKEITSIIFINLEEIIFNGKA